MLWLTATTALMQLTTLITFGKLQVGYSLALFQLSALIGVYFGHRYFQERNIRRRLLGSLIMVIWRDTDRIDVSILAAPDVALPRSSGPVRS